MPGQGERRAETLGLVISDSAADDERFVVSILELRNALERALKLLGSRLVTDDNGNERLVSVCRSERRRRHRAAELLGDQLRQQVRGDVPPEPGGLTTNP